MKKYFLPFLLAALTSCVVNNGHYDVLTSAPMSLHTLAADNPVIAENVEAVSQRHTFMLIPFGKAPALSEALQEILSKYRGDYMTDVSVSSQNFRIPFWYGYTSWKIEGNVVRVLK